jgi:hypothetical protein
MLIMLACGQKVRGFKPGRKRQISRSIKIRSTISLGEELQRSASCRFTAC